MTIAFVNSTGADAGTVATSTTLMITGFNAGNQMLVMARIGSTSVTPTLTVSTGSGTFTQDGSVTDSTNSDKLYWWRCTNGSSITQIQLAVSASTTVRWAAHWYSVGSGNTLATDKESDHPQSLPAGVGTITSNSTTTTAQANELLLGFMKTEASHGSVEVNAGTSYTIRQNAINKVFTEDQIVSATGTYAATFATAAGWVADNVNGNAVWCVIQTYFESSGATPVEDEASFIPERMVFLW